MSSLINSFQSFVSYIYNGITQVVTFVSSLFTWLSSFLVNTLAPSLQIVLPTWLFYLIWLGLFLMLVFLIVRIVIELL